MTAVRQLSDDTLLTFLSDVHIGGADGTDIFESAAELIAMLHDLGRHEGPVQLVLAGDFLDVLRMGEAGAEGTRITKVLDDPAYQDLFAALRQFRQLAPAGRRQIIYVIGNHDVEVWWNQGIQDELRAAGLVDEFALSYAASYASRPDDVIYCEHGNQFDPTNHITDYQDPLDTPLGAHIVTELLRPIGSGARVIANLDLRDVNYVFPLVAIPEWIAGRVFYRFLGEAIRWLLLPLVLVNVLYGTTVIVRGRAEGAPLVQRILSEAGYDLALLLAVFAILFLLARRAAGRAITALAARIEEAGSESESSQVHDLLRRDESPPMAPALPARDISVFVFGHTHAPSLSSLTRTDGRTTVLANTGCWLRQLQPIRARFGAPTVFTSRYVHTHLRVRCDAGGVSVELWEHPRPVDGEQLPWLERAAIAGRMPRHLDTGTTPRLLEQATAGFAPNG